MRLACTAVLLGVVVMGCSQPPAPRPEQPSDRPERHRLDWSGYDGAGDEAQAVYRLDGRVFGKGQAGIDALKKRIAKMLPGSRLIIGPYYGDPGHQPPLTYPFDMEDLRSFAKSHGVDVLIPAAR